SSRPSTKAEIRKMMTSSSSLNACMRSLTGVAGGWKPSCHGSGSAAAAVATSPANAASPAASLVIAVVNRTMSLLPPLRQGCPCREEISPGRARRTIPAATPGNNWLRSLRQAAARLQRQPIPPAPARPGPYWRHAAAWEASMTNLAVTDDLFFARTGMDPARVERLVGEALLGMDDGELFLEYSQSESVARDDGRIKGAAFDTTQGFGLRAIAGEAAGYAHATELSEAAIRRAGAAVRAVAAGHSGTLAAPPSGTNRALYTELNPLAAVDLAAKARLLAEIDEYARSRDPRVRQVMASLAGVWQAVQIVRPDGSRVADVRPLVRLNVAVVVGEGDRMETGSYGAGGRLAYERYLDPAQWRRQVDEALRQALVNLGSVPAPAGEMTVVLGPGWPGVMLHEAVGHGLEGDFNRKKTSAFSGLVGERVAAPG